MTKIIMHGCNGRMGHVIADIAAADADTKIVAGVDAYGESTYSFPVYKELSLVKEAADVIIDFSNAAAVDGLLDFAASKEIPVVLCSTGLSDAQLEHVRKASEKTAVLKSANMSVGINVLLKVLKEAAGFIGESLNDFIRDAVLKEAKRVLGAEKFNAVMDKPLNQTKVKLSDEEHLKLSEQRKAEREKNKF